MRLWLATMFTLRADLKGSRDTSFSVGRPINFPELVPAIGCFLQYTYVAGM